RAHILVDHEEAIPAGTVLVKIPRDIGKTRDITGGLPRVTELFEARSPGEPAVVSEIDGVVSFGAQKRGNREVIVTSHDGKERKVYMIALGKHVLVQENDFIRSGERLCDGAIDPHDILRIKGTSAVQEYLVNEIQEVYRMQGVKINDKHIEIIVRQMMQKVRVTDPGDTHFLEGDYIDKVKFEEVNRSLEGMVFVENKGDSKMKNNTLSEKKKVKEMNIELKKKEKKSIEARDAEPALSEPILLGITTASLSTDSFISAASFQETTKVLTDAAIEGKIDHLLGLKENVIMGHLIPAGTGLKKFREVLVTSKTPSRVMEKPAVVEEPTDAMKEEEVVLVKKARKKSKVTA
ncbi:MAG: DNA-directed RNA polymerase subunit beta', partial [Bacteroidota bacterium]